MIGSKDSSHIKVKNSKGKKKFNKNSSFSGVDSKKTPKSRRKSIATVLLPASLKTKEKERRVSVPGENDVKSFVVRRKLLDKTHSINDEWVESHVSNIVPKIKNKKESESSSVLSVLKRKKLIAKLETTSPAVIDKKTKTKKHSEDTLNTSNDIDKTEIFGIKASDIATAIKAVITLHKENPKLQNQLFEEDLIPLFLHLSCHKVPKGPSRIIRVPLPNSAITPDDEVCLIVPEVKGIKNIEHEKHIEHYENLLQRKGVENIKKIMTFHEFRTEYETYEQKIGLVNLYDYFLVDGKISGKVVKKCGKIFYKKRKVPTSVKLQATKLKENIDKALSKAFLLLHLKGNSYSVQFGHEKMNIQDLVDNAFAIIKHLNKEFPGGFDNIKGLHVSTLRSTSIPIYYSFKSPKEVKNPVVKLKKPKAYITYEDELSTLLNANVVVEPTGKILVKRTNIEEENPISVNEQNRTSDSKNTEESKTDVKKPKKRKRMDAENGDVKKKVQKINVTIENTSNENITKKNKKNKAGVINAEKTPTGRSDEEGIINKKKKVNKNEDVNQNVLKNKRKKKV